MKIDGNQTETTETALQTYRLIWQGIEVEARYSPLKWNVIAHLEVEAINPPRARLPITGTGYTSHFHPIGTIERDFDGDVVASVLDWLDTCAKDPTWQRYFDANKQGDLFA